MSRILRALHLWCALALLCPVPAQAQFTLMHSFTGGADNGAFPSGSLTQIGSTLYGLTEFGGGNNSGTIFKIQSDGTSFGLLHSFGSDPGEGRNPTDSLIVSRSTLYGMTRGGGSNDLGTVFEIDTDGSDFALLHSFAGGPADGRSPYGSLIQSGSTLYGMAPEGGDYGWGTIFKIGSDGGQFSVSHSFLFPDGVSPQGSLIQSGSTLYGMARSAGGSGYGTVFKIGADGTGFSVLHSYDSRDGGVPWARLFKVVPRSTA